MSATPDTVQRHLHIIPAECDKILKRSFTKPWEELIMPLPKLDSALEKQLWSNSHCISAYRICLKYEAELSEDKRRPIRILGFLLLYSTKDGVRVYLAKSIFSCNDNPEILVNLGLFFEQNVILPCESIDSASFSAYPYMANYVQSRNTGVEHQQPAPIHQGLLLRNTGKM